jgi:hypothetical protein
MFKLYGTNSRDKMEEEMKETKKKIKKKVTEKEELFIKCSYLTSAVHHPFTLTIHLLISFFRLPLRLRSKHNLNPP